MAQFYFFTDIDLLNIQTGGDAFGPIAGSLIYDEYRLCSLHTAGSDPSAYAICKGTVFVQLISGNSTNVNLILKPEEQPENNFPYIKYIIYKGIKTSSLFDGDFVALNTNDLTKSINTTQNLTNKSKDRAANQPEGTTTDRPSKKSLGIDLDSVTYPDTDSVDKLIYRDNVSYQFPIVFGGWKIGTFDSAQFGIEIITERVGFECKLTHARRIDDIFQSNKLVSSPTQKEAFEHWHKKEYVLDFIDPTCLWGSYYSKGLSVYSSNGTVEIKLGNDLYDVVISKFYNKNLVYIDIRNDHNYSFNYYNNYGKNIKINTNNTQVTKDYYNDGWPILRVQNSDLFASNNNRKNIIKVSFPNGDNTLPILYSSCGIIDSGNVDSELPEEPLDNKKFIQIKFEENATFSNEVGIAVPNKYGFSITTAICSLVKLRYLRQFDIYEYPQISTGLVYKDTNFLDNKFAIFDLKIPFNESENSSNILTKVYYEEIYFDDTRELYWDFAGTIGVSFDSNSVTFFSYPIDKNFYYSRINNIPASIITENKSGFDNFLSYLAKTSKDKFLRKSKLIGTFLGDVEYINFIQGIETITQANVPNYNDIISITFSKVEFEQLKTLKDDSGFSLGYKVFLGAKLIERELDSNGHEYQIYDLVLRGYEEVDDNLQIKEVSTDKKVIRYVSI